MSFVCCVCLCVWWPQMNELWVPLNSSLSNKMKCHHTYIKFHTLIEWWCEEASVQWMLISIFCDKWMATTTATAMDCKEFYHVYRSFHLNSFNTITIHMGTACVCLRANATVSKASSQSNTIPIDLKFESKAHNSSSTSHNIQNEWPFSHSSNIWNMMYNPIDRLSLRHTFTLKCPLPMQCYLIAWLQWNCIQTTIQYFRLENWNRIFENQICIEREREREQAEQIVIIISFQFC